MSAGTSRDLVRIAWQLYRAGSEHESRAMFQRAIEEGVRRDDAWYGLGELARRGGHILEAEAAFRSALALNQGHSNALFRLGSLAERRGQSDAAMALYREALAVHPGHVAAESAVAALSEKRRRTASPPQPPVSPPASPGPNPRDKLAVQPSGRGIAGPVHGVQYRMEQDMSRRGLAVLSFRVQPEQGPPVSVGLRGRSIEGHLINGEWVELPPGWAPGHSPRRVLNLTTGSYLSVTRPLMIVRAAKAVVATFVVVWIALLFAAAIVQAFFGVDVIEQIRDSGLENQFAR